MALLTQPTTELQAVNIMLAYAGELPVNTLEDTGVAEVAQTRTVLHNVLREVQNKGLEFNTDDEYKLVPNVDGYINLPSNVLKVDPCDRTKRYVRRGNKLYDKDNHTYVFTCDEVYVDITWFLPFEDAPQSVRDYVTIVAARRFVGNIIGSGDLDDLSSDDEYRALVTMMEDEVDKGDYSIFDSPDVYKVINRTVVPIIR